MLRLISLSYPINNAENIDSVCQLQQDMAVNLFCENYSKSCPAVRQFDIATMAFPMSQYQAAVKKFYSPRCKMLLMLTMEESIERPEISCVAFLHSTPYVPGMTGRRVHTFVLGPK